DASGRRHVLIALLDQQPVLLALLDFHERPLAVELVALELEKKFSLLQSFAPIFERDPFAAVPHNHAARAVITCGDDYFEATVLERMVFDFDGETLVIRVARRTLRHRPRS